ncbi:MAG TPA: hypothetical protein VD741_08705 [Solirubrobacterales bacterium]|nr:hypothetical protein [Solirubrobacterales bacterium]
MNFNEAAVFRWVVIVGIAGAAVVAVTLLTRPLVGALLGLVLVIAGCVRGYRWAVQRWHELGAKK